MKPIEEVRRKIVDGKYEFSKHAVDQSIIRDISVKDIEEAIAAGEIIEDYPDDKFNPSFLIYGRTGTGRPIHVHCSYPARPLIKIITIYEPDSNKWIEFKFRRLK